MEEEFSRWDIGKFSTYRPFLVGEQIRKRKGYDMHIISCDYRNISNPGDHFLGYLSEIRTCLSNEDARKMVNHIPNKKPLLENMAEPFEIKTDGLFLRIGDKNTCFLAVDPAGENFDIRLFAYGRSKNRVRRSLNRAAKNLFGN